MADKTVAVESFDDLLAVFGNCDENGKESKSNSIRNPAFRHKKRNNIHDQHNQLCPGIQPMNGGTTGEKLT